MSIKVSKQNLVHVYDSGIADEINSDLAGTLLELPKESYLKQSHFFHGRYENLYIEKSVHHALTGILQQALDKAAEILQIQKSELHLGFWVNLMHKGDVTTLHSHDDDDEVLSAVYYIQVPEGSGLFRLHQQREIYEIEPLVGRFMFFDPALLHEVSEHQSEIPRLSIGINIGKLNS